MTRKMSLVRRLGLYPLSGIAWSATLAAVLFPAAQAMAQQSPGSTECFPACRTGYVCSQKQCVSACNPQCAANQTCTSEGACIEKSAAAVSAPQPDPAPAPASSIPSGAAASPTQSDAGASAKSSAAGVHTHDGFYFRGGLGASFVASGSVSVPGMSQDVSVSGAGVALELALGTTLLLPGLVVGGGIYGVSVPSPSFSITGFSATGGDVGALSIGPFADWYPDPTGGLHVEASVGLASITAKKGDQYPRSDKSGTGFSVMGGVGYEWWIGEQTSLGVIARLQYEQGDVKGDGDTQSATVKLFVPGLLASLTYQ